MIHELKCWPEPFQAVVDRRKTHEFRKADRRFAVGDVLVLREWDPDLLVANYTGREQAVRVTYVSIAPAFGVPPGFVVMSVFKSASLVDPTAKKRRS